MKKDFKENFNFITNILILSLLVFGSLAWADSNGVWTLARDIQVGTFGLDEGDLGSVFTFVNPVDLNSKVTIDDDLNVTGDVRIYGGIHIGTNSLVYDDSTGVLAVGKLKLTAPGAPSDCLIYSNVSGDFVCSGLIGVGDIDTSQIQARITDTCTGNSQSIIGINSDGTVVCDDNAWVVSGSNIYSNIGNVGIGTLTPTHKLDVVGKIRMRNQTISTDADDIVVTKGYVDNTGGVPSGSIMAFYLSSCPNGWILANGVSGTPDLRGSFIRGMYGDINGRDILRILGSYQIDDFKSHAHFQNEMIYNNNIDGVDSTVTYSGEHHNEYRSTSSAGGSETRPKNIALLYCIKS